MMLKQSLPENWCLRSSADGIGKLVGQTALSMILRSRFTRIDWSSHFLAVITGLLTHPVASLDSNGPVTTPAAFNSSIYFFNPGTKWRATFLCFCWTGHYIAIASTCTYMPFCIPSMTLFSTSILMSCPFVYPYITLFPTSIIMSYPSINLIPTVIPLPLTWMDYSLI